MPDVGCKGVEKKVRRKKSSSSPLFRLSRSARKVRKKFSFSSSALSHVQVHVSRYSGMYK